jgi:hypothetical protein
VSIVVLLLTLLTPTSRPEVQHPNLESWGVCRAPETDSELERCGGLAWSIDLEAQHLLEVK